jgi:hypothetical protein
MGAVIGAAIGLGTAAVGAYQNSKESKANDERFQISREDYETRLKESAKIMAGMESEYNALLEERPDLRWSEFVKDKTRALADPALREFYTQAKEEDFDVMRQLAKAASGDNLDNVISLADELSGGKWKDYVDKRNELVMETNAADRYARSYELAAPVRTGASTVKYDDQGQLIEGQRADKQAFDIATEVDTQIKQEQKQDLRLLQQDTLGAAERQTERARDFMGFFDATGYATAAEADRSALLHDYQQTDEQRQFDLYKMFAGAAAGITPTDPRYVSPTGGNELISSGVKLASNSLSNYGNQTKQPANSNPYAA